MRNVVKLLASLIICLGIAYIGSIFTVSAIPTWYASLNKPFFTPPNWLFAPAWTTLYMLMAIAAFLVWKNGLDEKRVQQALIIFLVQLALNLMWSIVFFGLKSIWGGVSVIVLLWLAILLNIIRFYPISRAAAWLLLPYLLWVTFATALNIGVGVLN